MRPGTIACHVHHPWRSPGHLCYDIDHTAYCFHSLLKPCYLCQHLSAVESEFLLSSSGRFSLRKCRGRVVVDGWSRHSSLSARTMSCFQFLSSWYLWLDAWLSVTPPDFEAQPVWTQTRSSLRSLVSQRHHNAWDCLSRKGYKHHLYPWNQSDWPSLTTEAYQKGNQVTEPVIEWIACVSKWGYRLQIQSWRPIWIDHSW